MSTKIQKISALVIQELENFINSDLFDGGTMGFLMVNKQIEETILSLDDLDMLTIIIENKELLHAEIDDDFFEDVYLFKNKQTITLTDLLKSHLKPYILSNVMNYLVDNGFYKRNNKGRIEIK